MATDGPAHIVVLIGLAAIPLLWPALWNGYPLVFADTGTYLSQAIEHYAGWDRPVFYSLFLLPLHLTLTTWPAIAAQALIATYLLYLLHRTLLPQVSPYWLLPLTATVAATSALPWFVSQLMPDVFTGILVIALWLLICRPHQLTRLERVVVLILAAFMIAVHLSHVLLAAILLLVLLPLRRLPMGVAISPLALAAAAMVSVNLLAFGRASLSPFGNVFLLARVIYDGPGAEVLRRECPSAAWRVCPFIDPLPANSDDFLWRADGPVVRAGGAKLVSREADAIIAAISHAAPVTLAYAFLGNTLEQWARFASGDGLQAWPATVTPWIERDFPHAELAAYAAARQTEGRLAVPVWLNLLHTAIAVFGLVGCIILSMHRQPVRGLATVALLAVLVNGSITGGLSGPHDRYQSRIMWLPPLVALLSVASRRQNG